MITERKQSKVYELLAAFEELEASQGKIRSALGLASTDSVHVDSVKPSEISKFTPTFCLQSSHPTRYRTGAASQY
jgi:hypothetical protein